MVQALPNSNFSLLLQKGISQETSEEYREYRKAWEEFPQKFFLRDFPLHLDIETTNRCNLRCSFCDKLPLLKDNPYGDLDFELFKKVLDEGKDHRLWGLKLSYRGEPLLTPRIDEMVAYAKKCRVIDVYFNTNGMLLTEKISKRLIDAGLDRISISIEGTDPKIFEQGRQGASFETILRNLDRLLEIRDQYGSHIPRVRVQTVKFPGLDLQKYEAFWKNHADEIAAIDYKDTVNRRKGLENADWACPQLWQRMTIEWDGSIMPCNNDDFRHLSPGNIREKTVISCWLDPGIQLARESHCKGLSHLVKACDGCPWRTAQIGK